MKVGMHLPFEGLYNTLVSAEYYGLQTYQTFIRSNRGGKARHFSLDDIAMFNSKILRGDINDFIVHASYVMNPASTDINILGKTLQTINEDMYLLSRLNGRKYYVLHPGSAKDNSYQTANNVLVYTLHKLADKYKNTNLCLEIMSGQGTQLMSSIKLIMDVVNRCSDIPEFGVCVDLCHCFAAGIEIKDLEPIKDKIKVVHINNSLCDKFSRKDRHANLNSGKMSIEQMYEDLRLLESFSKNIVCVLETPASGMYEDFKLVYSEFNK